MYNNLFVNRFKIDYFYKHTNLLDCNQYTKKLNETFCNYLSL